MPEGLQIFNDAGFVQIDADFRNMEFRGKGSITIAGSNGASGGSNISYGYVTVTGENPVLIACSPGLSFSYRSAISGNNHTFAIYNAETSSQTIEYFIFDQPDSSSATNTGMQIFDGAGRLVFDSGKKYMRVLDYFESSTVSEDQTRNYSGKKVAALMCDFGYRYVVTASPAAPTDPSRKFIQSWLHCMSANGSSLRIRDMATFTNANTDIPATGTSEYPSRWLVIDVTNY